MSVNQKWNPAAIERYTCVAKIKSELDKENKRYLNKHPEVRAIIRTLLHGIINGNPTNFRKFAASIFDCNKSPLLEIQVNEHLKVVTTLLAKGEWSHYDCERLIGKIESSHSLLSNSSIQADINGILQYCMLLPTYPK